jgi:hypothetical protein
VCVSVCAIGCVLLALCLPPTYELVCLFARTHTPQTQFVLIMLIRLIRLISQKVFEFQTESEWGSRHHVARGHDRVVSNAFRFRLRRESHTTRSHGGSTARLVRWSDDDKVQLIDVKTFL